MFVYMLLLFLYFVYVCIWQHAKSLIEKAETRGGYTFLFQNDSKRIGRALEEAKKDNNFIYHAKVPELAQLSAIGKRYLNHNRA